MPNLSAIAIEKQKHGLSAENPFGIDCLYGSRPADEYVGDMHYALQIGITVSGATEIVYDGYSRICRAGECWWSMCWEPHACKIVEPRSFIVAINLDMDSLGQFDPFGGCHWLLPFTLPPERRFVPESAAEKAQFLGAAKELYHWHIKHPEYWKQKSWLLIHDLLLTAVTKLAKVEDLAREEALASTSKFARLRPAVSLARSAGAEPVTLAQAAKACSLSPSRFSEIFREAFGSSFGQFATRARLSQAAREVATSNLAVEEIAAKWGFFDSSHFCHAFKKIYQCSPSEFRRRRNNGLVV